MDNLHESQKQPESNFVHPSSFGDLEPQESHPSDHENALLPHHSDDGNNSVDKSDFQESKPAESFHKIGLFLEEDEGKIVVETQKMEVADNGKDGVEVPGMGEMGDFGNDASPETSESSKVGDNNSVKCAWRIDVIDDTALIETDALENKQRRLKRLVETAKMKNVMADDGIVKNVGLNVDIFAEKNAEGKKVYSREDLEALRYQGLDGQKKTWVAAYCGLGPSVQNEYDELVVSFTRLKQPHQPQQQKKKKNKKNHAAFNATPQFRNETPTAIFGPWDANQRGCYLKPLWTGDWPIGIFERPYLLHIQNTY